MKISVANLDKVVLCYKVSYFRESNDYVVFAETMSLLMYKDSLYRKNMEIKISTSSHGDIIECDVIQADQNLIINIMFYSLPSCSVLFHCLLQPNIIQQSITEEKSSPLR